ncbi:MAG: arsenite methyltransferase [Saprospiraceae bacterium]
MNKNNTPDDIKGMVRLKYATIAKGDKKAIQASCCGATESSKEVYNIMSEEYEMEGYNADADLGLGCGLPTQYAMIKKGNTVLDLGSGAGNDCFIARHEVGVEGKVIGIDFTPEMISVARKNVVNLGYNNVEFRQGDIDDMPVLDGSIDVVVSNCVLNLLPNKDKIFNEIDRVLKPGGHFSISDIVLVGELPKELTDAAEMYAGCVSGAIQKTDYLNLITKAGFEDIVIQKEKTIEIPHDILGDYLSDTDIKSFQNGNTGIFSITVFGCKSGNKNRTEKNMISESQICEPGGGCC